MRIHAVYVRERIYHREMTEISPTHDRLMTAISLANDAYMAIDVFYFPGISKINTQFNVNNEFLIIE